MTSKVLVKLPAVSFSQSKKTGELVAVAGNNRHDEGNVESKQRDVSGDRVAQLEQNIEFLQDQHQATLVALHQEVDSLRQKNRDLQFQLVFSKGTSGASSTCSSSPEEGGNGFAKTKGSPTCLNVTSLQVEILERELQDTKISLEEVKRNNSRLTEIVEQQKKLLQVEDESKMTVADVGIQVGGGMDRVHAGLMARLQDAEAMTNMFRRENEKQKKEITLLKASTLSGNASRVRQNEHSRANTGSSSQDESCSNKFPPLQSQSYWHRGSKNNHSFNSPAHCNYYRNGRNGVEAEETVLPQLKSGDGSSSTYSPFYRSKGNNDNNYQHHHHNGGGGGNNYYGGNRKYRGNRSHQRWSENRDYPRDHRQPKPVEFSDSTDASKVSKSSRKP